MAHIATRSSRLKLSAGKRHWQVVESGLAVGYRRPNRGGAGIWQARALIGDTHKIKALGTADDLTGADGSAVLDWKQAQAAARTWAATLTAAGPLTIDAAIQDYIKDLSARKGERAGREVAGRMRKHLSPGLAQRRLAELTTAELTKWRNELVKVDDDEDGTRRSRDTANRVLTIVRAAFNHAFNNGRVNDDRAWRTVKPFKEVGAARKVILSEEGLQRLVDAASPGLRELILAGALTGVRLGEITAASVRDFDADAAILTVTGKTGERAIHLPSAAVAVLRQAASGKRPQDHLLTTANGTPWTKSLHKRPFAAAVSRAGLHPDTVFYSLRHTWMSRALVNGVPVKAVGDHCGTSIAMLQRYYAKFIPGDQQRYATMAAPALNIAADADTNVIRLGQN